MMGHHHDGIDSGIDIGIDDGDDDIQDDGIDSGIDSGIDERAERGGGNDQSAHISTGWRPRNRNTPGPLPGCGRRRGGIRPEAIRSG